jgi:hypothetical protein
MHLTDRVCHSVTVLNELVLPIYSDSSKQNIVNILRELDEYFRLKCVPDSVKLPTAMQAITDNYTKQWFTAVYKDLTSYEQFGRR